MRKNGRRRSVPLSFVFLLQFAILFSLIHVVSPRKHLSEFEHHRVWRIPFDEDTITLKEGGGGTHFLTDMNFEPSSAIASTSILSRKNRDVNEITKPKYEVSPEKPIHILFPLPAEKGRVEVNPFGITIDLARPVVDEAVEDVYRRKLVTRGSLRIHFEDSKLSDAHGPNVAIIQLVKNQLDCIIGYAFVYALAPVARMSPYWMDVDSNGIPVITSVGLTSNLDNRKEYQLMTRISSPYKVVKDAVIALFRRLNLYRSAYIFHEQRHDNPNSAIPYGECYLLMASLQPYLYRLNKMEHNYFMFNELHYNKERMEENLRKASMLSNGNLGVLENPPRF